MGGWKIVYYETPSGRVPVEEFINSLQEIAQTKVFNTFELLAEFGINLGLPHAKKVTSTPLWEVRVLGETSLRFFYIAKVGREFLLLHGFSKKRQKIQKKEIKTALARLREHESRT